MNLRAADVLHALWNERTLAKTWAMRGTLHLLPAEDVPLYIAARGTDQYRKPHWLKYHELTGRDLDSLIEAVATVLDGQCLTRRELATGVAGRVAARVRSTLQSSWGEFLKPAAVRLLPAFDSYLLGHRNRGHVVDAADAERIYRKQAWISPTVIVNGRAVAVWSHVRKGSAVAIEVEPFEALAREEVAAIGDEAESLGLFLGGDGDVRIV